MSFIRNFDQSNKADWTFDITADAYDGDDNLIGPVDFTGAAVSFVVKDENNCQKLSATIGSGITQPVGTTLEVLFTASQMEVLCPGSYKIGCVYSLNGEINQLLTGTISVYDGVAKL
jgi:hypothetical protein